MESKVRCTVAFGVAVLVSFLSGANPRINIRLAGLELLEAIVGRASGAKTNHLDGNEQVKEKQLALESLLPEKEKIVKLCKSTLADSEAKVTALSSSILSSLAWWP